MPNLNVTFFGVFLYVHQGDQVSVLLPRTGYKSFGGVEPHLAQVLVLGSMPFARYDLDNLDVTIPGFGLGMPGRLPPVFANVGNATQQRIRDGLLGDATDPRAIQGRLNARARIRITKGAAIAPTSDKLSHFRFAQSEVQLTHIVRWEIEGAIGDVKIIVRNLGDLRPTKEIALTPTAPNGDYEIWIVHVPAVPHHNQDLMPGMVASHFASLYSLYPDAQQMPIPVVTKPAKSLVTHDSHGSSFEKTLVDTLGIVPATCVSGEG